MSDPIRKLAEEIVKVADRFDGNCAYEVIEARLRSALPELSELLGELAVARKVLEAVSNIFGRGYSTPERFEAALFDLEDEIRSALSPDSGRLAAELIRAVARERSLQRRPYTPENALVRISEEHEASNKVSEKLDALLSAFPGLRAEVERG